jgi:hypothetical protein
MDEQRTSQEKGLRHYRRVMFWSRVMTNLGSLERHEQEDFVNALFLFKINPESDPFLQYVREIMAFPEGKSSLFFLSFSLFLLSLISLLTSHFFSLTYHFSSKN